DGRKRAPQEPHLQFLSDIPRPCDACEVRKRPADGYPLKIAPRALGLLAAAIVAGGVTSIATAEPTSAGAEAPAPAEGITVTAAPAARADELLEADKAFRFPALAHDAATIQVHYAIADGYYLYREPFRFGAEQPSVTLGQHLFPKGKIHEDKFFGRQETYRK